jgi:hypothetical protein
MSVNNKSHFEVGLKAFFWVYLGFIWVGFSCQTCFVDQTDGRFPLLTCRYLCKTDNRDVYVPFSFLKSFYETAGDWAPGKEGREFDISLSYSKVRMDKFVSATVFLALSTISENFFDGQVVIVVDRN